MVTLNAQYKYVFAAKQQQIPSMIEAASLDLGMVIFTLLALGLAMAGQSARIERALIVACAIGSAGAELRRGGRHLAAQRGRLRGALAVPGPGGRPGRGGDPPSRPRRRRAVRVGDGRPRPGRRGPGPRPGPAVRAAVRPGPAVDRRGPAPGWCSTPPRSRPLHRVRCSRAEEVPAIEPPTVTEPPELAGASKKARLAWWYRQDPDYGNRAAVAAVAKRLAPKVDLSEGTARAYLGQILR